MKVGLLTIEQKDQLLNQLWDLDCYFNPIEDGNNNWVISTQEMEGNKNINYEWVKDLPLIDWVAPIEE